MLIPSSLQWMFLSFWLLPISSKGLNAQQFLNGSFEQSKFGCRQQLSNSGFTSQVGNTIAFGYLTAGLDVYTSDCGFGEAMEGDFFIGIRIADEVRKTAIVGLEASAPFLAGYSYTINFYQRANNRFAERNYLQFGLTNEAFEFGPIVAEIKGVSKDADWTLSSFQFTAPITAKYLTIKGKYGYNSRFLLDHFQVDCPEQVGLGADTIVCDVERWTLEPDGVFEQIYWDNGSSSDLRIVDEPGIYWVDVVRDDCQLSDTIHLEEYAYQCSCAIYFPNVFTPNQDGHNDHFGPYCPCEFIDYHLVIQNRWGQRIFEARDPGLAWDGSYLSQNAVPDVYVYRLEYRFSYQEDPVAMVGTITLVR